MGPNTGTLAPKSKVKLTTTGKSAAVDPSEKPHDAPPMTDAEKIAAWEAMQAKAKSRKTECPITLAQFRTAAPRKLEVFINGVPCDAAIKEFATGSLGWFSNGKIEVEIDGVSCTCQIGLNITLVGSKEMPR